jgi:hypothetical protein
MGPLHIIRNKELLKTYKSLFETLLSCADYLTKYTKKKKILNLFSVKGFTAMWFHLKPSKLIRSIESLFVVEENAYICKY